MSKIIKNFDKIKYGPAPEDSKEVYNWINKLASPNKIFINGQWIKSSSKKIIQAINPSNNNKLFKLSVGSKTDVNKAVLAAKKAYSSWSKLNPYERSKYLYALARLIQKHSRFLAVLETIDNGKPIRETRDIDIPLVARHFYYHAGFAAKYDQTKESIGVVGQIIPWNFPLLMLSWKIAPALACGNTVILKPAEYTSLTALFFAELCIKAKIPNGVINILTGDGSTGEHITNHPLINKIAFTGSTEVGKKIISSSSDSNKKLTMELGGKSPFIVFEDADLDSAVEGVVDAIWFNQGQVCCAGSRLLIQESVEKKFIQKLKKRMEKLRVGNPLDKSIDIGAIVAPVQLKKIDALVKKGIKEGAKLWQPSWSCPKNGLFYPPSLFTKVTPASFIAQVEIFGPVLTSLTFRTPSEAVSIANNTPYGLAASIWSENINLALDMAPKIKAGVIWINSTNLFDASCGFGGFKESGFGREGGSEGIRAYTKINIPKKKKRENINNKIKINLPLIDRTQKLYIGGKQKRPDGGYSFSLNSINGSFICDISRANRKDVRDCVEISSKSFSTNLNNFNRSQILYYLAENLQLREKNFIDLLILLKGYSLIDAQKEFTESCKRIFYYASMSDKFEGNIHNPPIRGLTLAMKEPLGVMSSVLNDDNPLLSLITIISSIFSTGNTNIVIPGQKTSLIATEFYQVLETSDVPPGYINILTSQENELVPTLSLHENINGIWYFGKNKKDRSLLIKNTTSNLKRYWCPDELNIDWFSNNEQFLDEFLYQSTQIKNIWIPYGE
ncbi:MAG: putative aldehyde dehydrogenase AldA [Alphaproteobacteria bacterium MarineAlpha5_Bin8]|nr:MAG: putative aldehyde dehydrogenase AldA [Alphaproteobacteria bacterium MarineAlpha5_Bin7]PPR46266.1 MAG: putative aldehyde dehydrogenase AldA [Alphaproteobacteria bacterium MarineAlpha5_Bin8]PPR53719.1 MAG: putative aldehyde dehydrogenase AldA [Alphaproteobacteria bacterium MarineAlpha5_Bin6]|tara:strand:- start:347 stop:2704 length:2358 start_codon:yes stop_codon:yes gene_type:complete